MSIPKYPVKKVRGKKIIVTTINYSIDAFW